MSSLLILTGSPSATSRTAALLGHLAQRWRDAGHDVETINVRDLSADALLGADFGHPDIARVHKAVAGADGVVVASPIYKAAYSGVLKTVLDVLPQFALAGKAVLPLATGGTPAHVLAIDYAFRPVLNSLGAEHIVQGWFVLDSHITVDAGTVRLDAAAEESLLPVVDNFAAIVRRRELAGVS